MLLPDVNLPLVRTALAELGLDGWLRRGGTTISATEREEWITVWRACNMGGQK